MSADYTAQVASNVLEHIPADVDAVRAAHRLVRPDGAVVKFVPVFPFAMSPFDRRGWGRPEVHGEIDE